MTRKELILQMFLTQYNMLTSIIDEMQRNLRYRKVTVSDCLELIIAIERLEMLKEMQTWVFSIMRIDEDKDFEELFRKYEDELRNKERF